MRTVIANIAGHRVRAGTLWAAVVVLSFLLHALWGAAFTIDRLERRERREAIEVLACAITRDARTSQLIAEQRGAPLDPYIVASKQALGDAAAALAGRCSLPSALTQRRTP